MYEVKVLSDQEFESLPYPDMGTSLGVADPRTNTAYVRFTGVDELDKYLINHELEHLIEGHGGEHSSHYRNGVYYKELGEMFSNIVGPAVGMFNPIAGAGIGIGSRLFGKKQKPQQSFDGGGEGQPNIMQTQGGESSAMGSFKPQAPNVVTPGAGQGGFGTQAGSGAINQLTGGRSPIERVRGFFSSRNPQGAF